MLIRRGGSSEEVAHIEDMYVVIHVHACDDYWKITLLKIVFPITKLTYNSVPRNDDIVADDIRGGGGG